MKGLQKMVAGALIGLSLASCDMPKYEKFEGQNYKTQTISESVSIVENGGSRLYMYGLEDGLVDSVKYQNIAPFNKESKLKDWTVKEANDFYKSRQ